MQEIDDHVVPRCKTAGERIVTVNRTCCPFPPRFCNHISHGRLMHAKEACVGMRDAQPRHLTHHRDYRWLVAGQTSRGPPHARRDGAPRSALLHPGSLLGGGPDMHAFERGSPTSRTISLYYVTLFQSSGDGAVCLLWLPLVLMRAATRPRTPA